MFHVELSLAKTPKIFLGPPPLYVHERGAYSPQRPLLVLRVLGYPSQCLILLIKNKNEKLWHSNYLPTQDSLAS
jgi:hypothetical protein